MVAVQRQCVIGSERCSGDAAARPAGPRRPPAGARPPPYSCATPRPRAHRGPLTAPLTVRAPAPSLMLRSEREARRSHRGYCVTPDRQHANVYVVFRALTDLKPARSRIFY
ncbi:hypothetical protein RR46_08427 [Papilio xuthus]|uniref:Uncharacterized protein n=1 Tax=Papilio xuthus TaxID=66420 RepID=A0A194PF55_PAPXU|nr:hypothetical protein RR46_08427 [Papilio xuthus]